MTTVCVKTPNLGSQISGIIPGTPERIPVNPITPENPIMDSDARLRGSLQACGEPLKDIRHSCRDSPGGYR